jgi:hypothetical protein
MSSPSLSTSLVLIYINADVCVPGRLTYDREGTGIAILRRGHNVILTFLATERVGLEYFKIDFYCLVGFVERCLRVVISLSLHLQTCEAFIVQTDGS